MNVGGWICFLFQTIAVKEIFFAHPFRASFVLRIFFCLFRKSKIRIQNIVLLFSFINAWLRQIVFFLVFLSTVNNLYLYRFVCQDINFFFSFFALSKCKNSFVWGSCYTFTKCELKWDVWKLCYERSILHFVWGSMFTVVGFVLIIGMRIYLWLKSFYPRQFLLL